MTLQRPNPIELYESAVQYLLPILAGVRPDQFAASTPCAEWSVQQLTVHTMKTPQRFHSFLTCGDPVDNMSVGDALPPEGTLAAYEAAFENLRRVIRAPGFLDRLVIHPRLGEMPGSQFIMSPFIDALIHKWDLAKATNQDTSLDSALAEVCYKYLMPEIESRRSPQLFGPSVTLPMSASIQDKLLALTGRQP